MNISSTNLFRWPLDCSHGAEIEKKKKKTKKKKKKKKKKTTTTTTTNKQLQISSEIASYLWVNLFISDCSNHVFKKRHHHYRCSHFVELIICSTGNGFCLNRWPLAFLHLCSLCVKLRNKNDIQITNDPWWNHWLWTKLRWLATLVTQTGYKVALKSSKNYD